MNGHVPNLLPISPEHREVSKLAASGDWQGVHELAKRVISAAPTVGHGFALHGPDVIFAPLSPPDYLVEGAIRRASLVLLGAYGSSGKTWTMLDLGLAVATGGQWLGRHPCKQGSVAILDYESGDYELKRRTQLIARARAVSGRPTLAFASFPGLYMNDPAFAGRIEALAKEHALILIDSLAAMNPGVDENSSAMRVGLDVLRAVGERTGCVFVVLLHAKKTSGNKDEIDPRELFRGSSAIYDAADVAFAIVLRKKQATVHQTKARHGRALEPFALTVSDVGDGVAVLAEDLTEPNDAQRRHDETKGLVMDVLAVEHTLTAADVIAVRVERKAADVRTALKDLLGRGIVTKRDGVFRLTSDLRKQGDS